MEKYSNYVFGKLFDDVDEACISYIEKNIADFKKKIYYTKLDDILNVLDDVGKIFADKNSLYYKRAIRDLVLNIKFSKKMIEKTLDIVPQILNKNLLKKRLELELIFPYALDGIIGREGYDGYIRAYPYGVVFHVGAGNVFIGILDSLVMGIITKNINIVKVSSKGSNFMNIFAQALDEVDKKKIVSKSFSILRWKGGNKNIEDRIIRLSDLIMVWGGYDVCEYYKRNTPFNVGVEIFGPKTSFGIVFEDFIYDVGYREVARRIVRDVSMWDQSACSNMHDLYVVLKSDNDNVIRNLMRAIVNEFKIFERNLPCGKIDENEMVEIVRAREIAKVDASMSLADVRYFRDKYTVIYEKDPSYRLSPLNRTLYVKCVKSIDEVKKYVKPYKDYLQSLGIGGSHEEKKMVVECFYDSGVMRFCDLGSMSEGEEGSPHDGRFVLQRLVKWVGLESKKSVDRLIELVDFARRFSNFYKKHYGNIDVKGVDDFKKLPLVDKEHLYNNTPPKSKALFTTKDLGGIYFASGGSTGKPKYVFYSHEEYDTVVKMLAKAYISAGLEKGDVIANLFVSGNLWSSWLSVEKSLSYTGVKSVPIGSNIPIEDIVKYLKEFNVNAVVGLPSFLLKLAEYVKRTKIKLNINKIFYGGEYITDEMIVFFKDIFGHDCLVKSAGYATADAGVIGWQCRYLSKGYHHIFDETHYLELLDPDTLKSIEKGKIGEVVITCLYKKTMPLIRYRVGDLARWVDIRCKCGSLSPVIEIVGRCDDRIHAGGAHIFVWDIQKAISCVDGLSFNFQVVVDKKDMKDTIEIVVESDKWMNADELSKKLGEKIIEYCKDLSESIKMGWIDKPLIRIVPPNTIERIKRTGKIKRVVDKRIKI